MALTSTEAQVAPFGRVYIANVGAAVPNNPVETLNVAWKDLGYLDENGVSITPAVATTPKKAWQALLPIKNLITDVTLKINFTLLQSNEVNLEAFFFFADLVNASGYGKMDVSSNIGNQNRALLVEYQNELNKNTRLVFPNCLLADRSALQLHRSDLVSYGLTFDAQDYNGNFMYVRSEDAGLVPTT